MEKGKAVYEIRAKRKNRRATVTLFKSESGEHSIVVVTERLIDFKTRHIARLASIYTVESFVMLNDLFTHVLNEPTVKKAINRETNFPKWSAEIYNGLK